MTAGIFQRIWFGRFLDDWAVWSQQNHKVPRIEQPHNRFTIIGPPSTFGSTSTGGWPEKQENSAVEVMCGRPGKSSWINVRIMHRVFNEMMEALRENSTPQPCGFKLARILSHTMPSSFPTENAPNPNNPKF